MGGVIGSGLCVTILWISLMNGDWHVLMGQISMYSQQLSLSAIDGFGMGWLDGMGGKGE
jgi:hypothetical protein